MPKANAPKAPCVEVCESPTGDDEPRLRDAEFGADHVHDALARIVETVIAVDAVGGDVFRQQIDHVAHFGVGDGGDAAVRG